MIERELVNVTDVGLYRAQRTGAGGGSLEPEDVTLYAGLLGIHEPADSSAQTVTASDHVRTETLWIDPVDGDGNAIDVHVDDLVDWTDRMGRTVTKRRIRRVQDWWCGSEIDHLELEV